MYYLTKMDNVEKSFINFESAGTLNFQHPYHLWETSTYYNTNELSPRNIVAKQASVKLSEFSKEEVVRDAKNRRIISKESLYKNTEFSEESNEDTSNDWSLEYQQKPGKESAKMEWRQKPIKSNKIQMKIDKAVSQPVKIDKAASMMAKMGWEGGALGKSGTGIMEPIIPNAAYAVNTAGFGRPEPKQNPRKIKTAEQIKKQDKRKLRKDLLSIFHTNVLYRILEFMQNDFEVELMFENTLQNVERKRIHDVINNIDKPNTIMNKCSLSAEELRELFNDLHKHSYVLTTQSEGFGANRSLCIYKEAPEHMYLVTHHDLRNEPEDTEEIIEETDNHDNKNSSDLIMDVEPVNASEVSQSSEVKDEAVIDLDDKTDEPIVIVEQTASNDEIVTSSALENTSLQINEEATGEIDVVKAEENTTETVDKSVELLEHISELTENVQDAKTLVDDDTKSVENTDAVEIVEVKENIRKPLADSITQPENPTETKLDITKMIDSSRTKKNSANKIVNEAKLRRKQERYEKFRAKLLEKKANKKMLAKVEKDNNPTLKRILNPQKTSYAALPKEEINNLILEFFKEFNNDKKYTEFKFLGAFEDVEVETINEFINNVWSYVNDADYVSDDVYTVMSEAGCALGVREDSNGAAVIYKMQNGHKRF